MSVTLRKNKATPLTFDEVDNNFSFLNNEIATLRSGVESGDSISDSYIRSLISGTGGIVYNSDTGALSLSLTTDNIDEGNNNLYYKDQRVDERIKNQLSVGSGLSKVESGSGVLIRPNNFNIRITGAVIGNATVDALSDVVINTTPGTGFTSAPGDSESSTGTGIGFLARSPGQLDETEFEGIEFDSSDFAVQATDTYVRITSKVSDEDIISTVGTSISGTVFGEDLTVPIESGIVVTYDEDNGSIRVAPRDFTIAIDGAVAGSATVRRLGDTTITVENTNDFIQGIGIQEGTVSKNSEPVTNLNFGADDFDISVIGNTATIELSDPLTEQEVRDIIGNTVVGTERLTLGGTPTETGIVVNYDAENNVLEVAPRDFTLSLIGDVTGSATISKLGDTTIAVSNSKDYIEGIDVLNGSTIQNSDPITKINFCGEDFAVSVVDDKATIELSNPFTEQEVRDIIGTTIVGTERLSGSGTPTETGIVVNYDAENDVLEVAPRDFVVTLVGDVSGTATVTKLRNTTIQTTTSAIKGINVETNGIEFLSLTKGLNFSNNFTLVKDAENQKVTVDFENIVDDDRIRTVLNNSLTGAQDGIVIDYDENEAQFSYRLSDLSVDLVGAVTGTGNISYNGSNAQTLTVVTEIGEVGSGLAVQDEGQDKGESVSTINFVGTGVTSSVTVDGQVATVNIPNSPAAEKFILIDSGSANVPNARRLQAGTGIALNDGGAGGDFTISATGGDVLGKIQVEDNGELIAEEPTLNVVNSQQVYINATHDGSTNTINIVAYSKLDGWYRQDNISHGEITDKYGNSLDMGDILVGIIEHQIDFGEIA